MGSPCAAMSARFSARHASESTSVCDKRGCSGSERMIPLCEHDVGESAGEILVLEHIDEALIRAIETADPHHSPIGNLREPADRSRGDFPLPQASGV